MPETVVLVMGASRMLAEIPMRSHVIAARCVELPMLLTRVQEPGTMLAWSSESFDAEG